MLLKTGVVSIESLPCTKRLETGIPLAINVPPVSYSTVVEPDTAVHVKLERTGSA